MERLLRPRSIAVIGGGTWCANVLEQCRKIGFLGDLWAVHPTRNEVGGVPAFASVQALPSAPDAAFVGVNRDVTVDVVQALSDVGAGGAVCFAAGFQEAQAETGDGAAKQAALLQAAGDMPILGPNCYGFINALDGAALWPDQHGAVRVEKGVALVTQSSNIAINLTMQRRGLPLAYVVTAGNQAQTGLSQITSGLLQDPRVSAVGLHIEGIDDLKAFEAMAQEAQRLGKPLVALKVGKSAQAQAATVSHTASLAGSDAGARALFHRLGIGQVDTLSDLLETLKLLHICGPLPSNRIASMSCSGGEASLMADSAVGRNVVFPSLSNQQSQDLRAALGPMVALANPLDYQTYIWGDTAAMTATFTAIMQGDVSLGCVVLDFPRTDLCDAAAWEPVVDCVAQAQIASGKPIAVVSSLTDTLSEDTARALMAKGIVPLNGIPEAMTAIDVAAALGRCSPQAPVLVPPAVGSSLTLTEADAKEALLAFGLRVPRAVRVTSHAAIEGALQGFEFPVVLKGEGIAHKTEAGAVALNLHDAQAVLSAAHTMPTDQFLIEEMITGTVVELLIGVMADPAHGYVLTLAAGGVLTELMQDSVSLSVPATRRDVEQAVRSLKIAPCLDGFRGAPSADMNSLLDGVMAVQDYVAHARPYEVEINPLMCTPTGAIAADALIRIGEL